jgi:predicted PurR-regulated permease PerM
MRCGNCEKLCDTGKLAWSQMNPFGKVMEIFVALFKTFFTGLLLALLTGFAIALLFQPTHEWMQANRPRVTYAFLFIGLALSVLRTAWYYWTMIPEVERITREKKWDEWMI